MNPKMDENKNFNETQRTNKVIDIKRKAFDWKEFSDKYGKKPQKDIPFYEYIEINVEKRLKRFSLKSLFPIIKWLPNYQIKKDLCADIIAGLTISVLHVPQGIGNAFILGLDPINGLYVSLFPVLIYTLMGTSRHLSIGSFVVVSLMLSNIVRKLEAVPTRATNATNETETDWPPTNLEVLTTVTITTGILQIIMGFLSLGSLSLILSDELVSSFTTGVAFHVVMSQLDTILGIVVPNTSSGPFKLIRHLEAIRNEIHNSNTNTIIVSVIVMTVLLVYKEWVEPKVQKKTPIPMPIDLVVVIISTLISWFTKFNEKLKIKVVGELSTGLPIPIVPRFDFIWDVFLDSIIIATVTFALSLSLAKIFAKRQRYEINANQELIALGSANVFASFFSTFPASAALSRSTVQERVGGKTQIAGLFSCLVILSVVLVFAPYLYHLPQFVLSCIIIIAIKSLFKQFKDFWEFWFISKLDATVWMVTFLSIIFLDVDIGLIFGILFSLHVILIRIILPSSSILGNLPPTEMYADIKKYRNAEEVKDIKIFRFCSPIFFLSKDVFKRRVFEISHIELNSKDSDSENNKKRPKTLIIDMSCVPFMDKSGVETIVEVIHKLEHHKVVVCLVSCPIHVIEVFEKTKFFNNFNKCCVYPTIHDAVISFK